MFPGRWDIKVVTILFPVRDDFLGKSRGVVGVSSRRSSSFSADTVKLCEDIAGKACSDPHYFFEVGVTEENIDILGGCFFVFRSEWNFLKPTEDDVFDFQTIQFAEKIGDSANFQFEFTSSFFRFTAAKFDPKKVEEMPGKKHGLKKFALD